MINAKENIQKITKSVRIKRDLRYKYSDLKFYAEVFRGYKNEDYKQIEYELKYYGDRFHRYTLKENYEMIEKYRKALLQLMQNNPEY